MTKLLLFIGVSVILFNESIAQTKIKDTIGGVILTSYSVHRMNIPFIRRRTIMYFINIEDKYVLRFDGLQSTMDGVLISFSMLEV